MLGDISGKYESGNRAGAVSSGAGDLGGVSYGAHQFIASVADAFVEWLWGRHKVYAEMLGRYRAGTEAFSDMWQQIARMDHDGFLTLQHEYTQKMYYDPAVVLLRRHNYDVEKHSDAVKEMVFSRAVQYGPDWMPELFTEGMKFKQPDYLNLSYIDHERFDTMLIEGVHEFLERCCDIATYRGNGIWRDPDEWTCGSEDVVKVGLKNRFINEKADLLAML